MNTAEMLACLKPYTEGMTEKYESNTVAAVERFGNLPNEMRDLFFRTIVRNAQQSERAVLAREEAADEAKSAGIDLAGWTERFFKDCFEGNWSGNKKIWALREGKMGWLERNFPDAVGKDPDCIDRYLKAKETLGKIGQPITAVIETVESLERTLSVIADKLGGLPDYCEAAAEWGAGDYYNGVIGRAGKRFSLKSFLAGGYNIQRLHLRCRCTPLKEAAA